MLFIHLLVCLLTYVPTSLIPFDNILSRRIKISRNAFLLIMHNNAGVDDLYQCWREITEGKDSMLF